MTKQEQDIVDSYVKKICKLEGELRNDSKPFNGTLHIWFKKSEVVKLLNEMVKELKEQE